MSRYVSSLHAIANDLSGMAGIKLLYLHSEVLVYSWFAIFCNASDSMSNALLKHLITEVIPLRSIWFRLQDKSSRILSSIRVLKLWSIFENVAFLHRFCLYCSRAIRRSIETKDNPVNPSGVVMSSSRKSFQVEVINKLQSGHVFNCPIASYASREESSQIGKHSPNEDPFWRVNSLRSLVHTRYHLYSEVNALTLSALWVKFTKTNLRPLTFTLVVPNLRATHDIRFRL